MQALTSNLSNQILSCLLVELVSYTESLACKTIPWTRHSTRTLFIQSPAYRKIRHAHTHYIKNSNTSTIYEECRMMACNKRAYPVAYSLEVTCPGVHLAWSQARSRNQLKRHIHHVLACLVSRANVAWRSIYIWPGDTGRRYQISIDVDIVQYQYWLISK